MNRAALSLRFASILTLAFGLSIAQHCAAEDDVVIRFKSNGVIESKEFGTQVFDPSDDESLAELKEEVQGRRLVLVVEEDVPFADLKTLQKHLSAPELKLAALSVQKVPNEGDADDADDAVREKRAAILERHRATERLSALFDERQKIQLEKIELQMRKLEALKRKVELRAKRKAEIVAKQVEASLGHDKPYERDSDGIVSMIHDPTMGTLLKPEGKASSTPRNATSYSKVDIRLRKNDLEIAEVKLERAITKFEVLQRAFERNQVSRIEFQDAEYGVQQAKLELNRARILLEEASHQNASGQRRPNQDQTKFMQRLLENQLQQANAMADKQSQLAAMAKTRYEAGTTTLESVVEAQAQQKVTALEVEKIQMQLEALQRGIALPEASRNLTDSIAEISTAEAIRRNLEDSLAKLHEDVSRMSKRRRPFNQDSSGLVDRLEAARLQAVELSQLKNRADMKLLQLNLFEAKSAAELGRLDDANLKLQGAIQRVRRLESLLKEQKSARDGGASKRRSATSVDSDSAESALQASDQTLKNLAAHTAALKLQKARLSTKLTGDNSIEAERTELQAVLDNLEDRIRGAEKSAADLNTLKQHLEHDRKAVQELRGFVYPTDQAKESLQKAEVGVRESVNHIFEFIEKAIPQPRGTN